MRAISRQQCLHLIARQARDFDDLAAASLAANDPQSRRRPAQQLSEKSQTSGIRPAFDCPRPQGDLPDLIALLAGQPVAGGAGLDSNAQTAHRGRVGRLPRSAPDRSAGFGTFRQNGPRRFWRRGNPQRSKLADQTAPPETSRTVTFGLRWATPVNARSSIT